MMKHGVMGVAMAAMMLWMLHDPIMSGRVGWTFGALVFGVTHFAVVMAFAALALMVPKVRQELKRHRPGAQHMAAMLAGALVFSGGAHIALHGGV